VIATCELMRTVLRYMQIVKNLQFHIENEEWPKAALSMTELTTLEVRESMHLGGA
jgi:hypothetical protein